MQIYYPSLQAIEQQTRQLDLVHCTHCQQAQHLVSHGFVRKKQVGAEPKAVGKRVFCSNRNRHSGCGRTLQLYVDATIRYLHYAGCAVVAFLLSLAAGMSIQQAYQLATGTATPRQAYRWLHRLVAQLSVYRSLCHQPPLQETATGYSAASRPPRLMLLTATAKVLLQRFGQPLCAVYQRQRQRTFL